MRFLGLINLALLLAASLSAQGLLVRGSGGIAPPCGAGISTTNLESCWTVAEESGDTMGDVVGTNDGQLGSSAGADANDPNWNGPILEFTEANSDRVVIPAFNDASDAFTLTVVTRWTSANCNSIPFFVSQLGGSGTALRYLGCSAGERLFNNFGTPVGANEHSVTLASGQWYALTIRHDGAGEVCLAVNDGTLECTTETVPTCDGDLLFGADNDLSGNFLTGGLAHAMYYSTGISGGTIASNFAALDTLMLAEKGIDLTP